MVLFCEELMSESCENMTKGAAILCPAVCISDVINGDVIGGKSISMSEANHFLHFIIKEQVNPDEPKFAAQMHLNFVYRNIHTTTK